VPGLEEQEARSLIPRTSGSPKNWVVGHPLERISHYTRDVGSVPPRCLIPGYPDDPKSRFRDELDEEVSKRRQSVSAWKSVKTLDQFWEMMAFRQECSSGRLTGFIWLVFDSDQLKETHPQASVLRDAAASSSKSAASPAGPNSSRSNAAKRKGKPKRKGPIATRAPRIKTHSRNYRFAGRTTTAYYSWPVEGRGAKIVNESEYKRIVELLLHLDFSTLDKAIGSSQRWIGEVDAGASWDGEVVGTAPLHVPNLTGGSNVASAGVGGGGDGDGKVANLTGTGLVRRKKGSEVSGGEQLEVAERISGGATAGAVTEGVNLLGANLVRKKKKGSDGQ
jgi:regulator of Ty1 transposition protein 109